MGSPRPSDQPGNRRMRLTRFIVPHDSFDWYTRGIALTTLATCSLVGGATWLYHRQLFHSMGLLEIAEHPEVLDQYARLSLISTGIVVLVVSLYITLAAGFLFHRVAGPIYRMRKHMLAIVDGEPVRELAFRNKDQLADLCDAYNQLLYKLDVIESKPLEPGPDLTGASSKQS